MFFKKPEDIDDQSTKEEQEALMKQKIRKRRVITYVAVGIAFAIVTLIVPDDIEHLQAWTLLPAGFLLVYVFSTKRIAEALILTTILGCLMGYKLQFYFVLNEVFMETLMEEDTVWLIMVCGLMGGIVAIIEKSGGSRAFAEFAASKSKGPRSTMFWTMICCALLSLDEYLSILTAGTAMTPVLDKYKVPREMTAYVLDSSGAPICIINPISSWAVFIGALMVAAGLGPSGSEVLLYVQTIPFNFYGIFALIVLVLTIIGVIPKFGPMKKAYERVQAGGPMAPAGSEKIDIKAGTEGGDHDDTLITGEKPQLINFIVPMVSVVGATIALGFDVQLGVLTSLFINFVFFVFRGMDPAEYFDEIIRGFKNMLFPLFLLILAFSFANVCDRIGFMDFVIDVATENIPLMFLPVAVFCTFFITEFIMGINWGMYAIAIPIVVPIAITLGCDPVIAVAAVAAAGVWGCNCCFYADATVLTSAACGCDNFRHGITQLPFGMVAGVLSIIGYLIVGIVMYG